MNYKLPPLQELVFNILIAILLILTAFGLGRLYAKPQNNETREKIKIEDPPANFEETFLKKDTGQPSEETSASQVASFEDSKPFVASKNGTKYYPSKCSAANRINPENKVYFETEAEAQAQGLSRTVSKSCDNLWPSP
jgi:hypothetical protein